MPSVLRSPLAGLVLCRVVVPLWVLTGAVFKLAEQKASLLPETMRDMGLALGLDLYWWLALLIAAELLAVGVMLFLGRLARPMAIFMLTCFCLILLNEIRMGNTSCGCLGAASPSPGVMLAIDGVLLLGAIILPTGARGPLLRPMPAAGAAAWTVAGAIVTAAIILPAAQRGQGGGEEVVVVDDGAPAPVSDDAGDDGEEGGNATQGSGLTATPAGDPDGDERTAARRTRVVKSPPAWYLPSCEEWIGKAWSELDIAQFMRSWPRNVSEGRQYVMFYRDTCDHCHDLLMYYFADGAPVPTTLVAVPDDVDGFAEAEHEIPCADCARLELPVGCEWIITTPIMVALEDGRVVCAKEGEDPEAPECLTWH